MAGFVRSCQPDSSRRLREHPNASPYSRPRTRVLSEQLQIHVALARIRIRSSKPRSGRIGKERASETRVSRLTRPPRSCAAGWVPGRTYRLNTTRAANVVSQRVFAGPRRALRLGYLWTRTRPSRNTPKQRASLIVPRGRIELPTLRFSVECSTTELPRLMALYKPASGRDRTRTCDLLGVNEAL